MAVICLSSVSHPVSAIIVSPIQGALVLPLSISCHFIHSQPPFKEIEGGGPRVVVSTAAFHARVRGSVPGLGGLKETKMFLPHPRVKVSIVGSLRDREVACSASDRQGSNFESCVWRAVSSQSSHHPQEVLLAQFSQYVHKGGLKPDSFHFKEIDNSILSPEKHQKTQCWFEVGPASQRWPNLEPALVYSLVLDGSAQ